MAIGRTAGMCTCSQSHSLATQSTLERLISNQTHRPRRVVENSTPARARDQVLKRLATRRIAEAANVPSPLSPPIRPRSTGPDHETSVLIESTLPADLEQEQHVPVPADLFDELDQLVAYNTAPLTIGNFSDCVGEVLRPNEDGDPMSLEYSSLQADAPQVSRGPLMHDNSGRASTTSISIRVPPYDVEQPVCITIVSPHSQVDPRNIQCLAKRFDLNWLDSFNSASQDYAHLLYNSNSLDPLDPPPQPYWDILEAKTPTLGSLAYTLPTEDVSPLGNQLHLTSDEISESMQTGDLLDMRELALAFSIDPMECFFPFDDGN